MCPLRPATDHCLGEPLPHQLANQPRAPLSANCSFPLHEDYAVLAPVSQGYSPPKGRLPTCYSPVRHFTQGLLPFLVRLACVKRAASVDSEPGSNSRLILFCTAIPIATCIAARRPSYIAPVNYSKKSDEFTSLRPTRLSNNLRNLPNDNGSLRKIWMTAGLESRLRSQSPARRILKNRKPLISVVGNTSGLLENYYGVRTGGIAN